MGWRPRLSVVCGRCGRAHGLLGTCVATRKRKGPLKPRLDFGRCPGCRRKYGPGGQLTHHCAPKSDFGKRKSEFEKEQKRLEREKARKARPKHDYTECSDGECKRSLCVAYKAGRELGDLEGYARGWDHGHARGAADCPRDHTLGDCPWIMSWSFSPSRRDTPCSHSSRRRGPASPAPASAARALGAAVPGAGSGPGRAWCTAAR